jgi:BTB/POZ domain
MDVYPNGNTTQAKGYVTVLLSSMCLDEANIDVTFTLALVDQNGVAFWASTYNVGYNGTTKSYGGQMVAREVLKMRAAEYLPYDKLLVRCDLEFPRANGRDAGAVGLSHSIVRNLQDERFFDFTIKVGDNLIRAHRFILAGASSVFDAMLEPYTKEYQDQQLVISDFAYPTMSALVSFLYTGKIRGSQITEELLRASDKYFILGLKRRCERLMACDINEQNAVDTLIASDQANSPRLQKVALRFVAKNTVKVMDTISWKRQMRSRCDLIELVLRQIVDK